MSSSTNPAPDVPADKKKGGLLSRMRTVLKRSDGSKRLSFSSKTFDAGPSATKASASTAITPLSPVPEQTAPIVDSKTFPVGVQPKKLIRSDIDAERARKLGERFHVTINPGQFKRSEKEVYRVEKPIRMRIHRHCHKCNTVFGSNKICSSCEHVRCKSCPRSPPKKTEKKDKENVPPTVEIEVDHYWNMSKDFPLTKPSLKPGAQPLVKKKPMQRVRRNCCECNSLFTSNAKICLSCHHGRCADCPRDPAKKKKYPDGYPGDAFSQDTSIPVKYSCHKCTKVYPGVPHPSSGEEVKQDCIRCGHPRCASCTRAPPQKVEPEPDPEIVKRVEAKLAALSLSIGTTAV